MPRPSVRLYKLGLATTTARLVAVVIPLKYALQPGQRLAMLSVRTHRSAVDSHVHDARAVQIDWPSPQPRKMCVVLRCLGIAHLVHNRPAQHWHARRRRKQQQLALVSLYLMADSSALSQRAAFHQEPVSMVVWRQRDAMRSGSVSSPHAGGAVDQDQGCVRPLSGRLAPEGDPISIHGRPRRHALLQPHQRQRQKPRQQDINTLESMTF